MLNPFEIEVKSGHLGEEHQKEEFPRQSAFVEITNLSYREMSNCVLDILQIAPFDNQRHELPRFVTNFSLPSGDTQKIEFLSWTTRSPPHANDPTFRLSGPIAPVYGGNVVTLPRGSYDIDIEIAVPEADPIIVRCCVWADGNVLRAVRED